MYKSGSIKISQRNPTEINKNGANAKVKAFDMVFDVFFFWGGGGGGHFYDSVDLGIHVQKISFFRHMQPF